MIELIVLYMLASWARNQARAKGHPGGKYAALMVGLWTLGEVTGGILGAVVFYGDLMTYVLALAGAAAGASLAAAIIRNLESVGPAILESTQARNQMDRTCPNCGQTARAGDRFCRQCGAELGAG